jgi:molecular chaperone DnaK (HSP70)
VAPAARFVVGIDLGTTHTVVAWSELGAREAAGAIGVLSIPQRVTATETERRPLLASCLYAPLAGEAENDAWDEPPWVAGELARARGAQVPGRFVASAKSWLCHPAVDRLSPILPWGAGEESDVPRISPVDASARYLTHVRRAWDAEHPGAPLAEQEIVLTVPASFDEVARELTLDAAARAGLEVRLLEEPQAAFYDYMYRAGSGGMSGLEAVQAHLDPASGEGLVLVCDVGGGTTDLSLIRVARGEDGGQPEVSRVAVGRHLLLGGDNMDLALAHLCEPRLSDARLDAARFAQLVVACRGAKEALLAGDAPDDVPVTLLAAGSQLLGGTRTTRLTREETARTVLDGFFPLASRDAQPLRTRAGLVAFGLPYEADVAITHHVAAFFARHTDAVAPRAVLLNGGVFRAGAIATRLVSAIDAWGGPPVTLLPNADPDLAVARGAVAYAMARRGHGVRIGGGSGRGFYVEVATDPGEARRAVCVVPRGAQVGAAQKADRRRLSLVVGRPVRFELLASDDASGHRSGDVVTIDDDHFERLPPIATTIAAVTAGPAAARSVDVILEGELTEVGTLDLACVEVDVASPRRFRLAFQLRDPDGGASVRPPATTTSPPGGLPTRALEQAREAIDRVFGKSRGDVAARAVKDLVRDLERLLGERGAWTAPVARALYDAVFAGYGARRRSPDHERVFWQLSGFCLRPGFGDAGDPARVRALSPLFAQRLAFPDQARTWQQFWIAWRRVAAGLDDAAQTAMRDAVDPLLAPPGTFPKKGKSARVEAPGDLLDMASSLERVPPARRAELGGWILDRTWTDRDPRLWAAIGRLGARVPAYASVDHVVSPAAVERWIDQLLRDTNRELWELLPGAPVAAVQLARVTGDRARDVSERVRKEVLRRLEAAHAPPESVRAVRERVEATEAERAAFYGEGLPVGLRLA